MWNPFQKPETPRRLTKRIELLELRATDQEDSIEKLLYQQSKLLGKINARHKKQLEQAELALEGAEDIPAVPFNGMTLPAPTGDLKAHLRQKAAELRRLR